MADFDFGSPAGHAIPFAMPANTLPIVPITRQQAEIPAYGQFQPLAEDEIAVLDSSDNMREVSRVKLTRSPVSVTNSQPASVIPLPTAQPDRQKAVFELQYATNSPDVSSMEWVYADIILHGDLLIFVEDADANMWVPPILPPGQVAVAIPAKNIVCLAVTLPLQFPYGDKQFRFMMIEQVAQQA